MTTPEEHSLPKRDPLLHNAALAAAIISPLAMLLPPRKFDARFAVLSGAFSLSTNHLCYEYTGVSLYSRFRRQVSGIWASGLPPEAVKTQQILREHKEREAALRRQADAGAKAAPAAGGLTKVVDDIWMGGQGKDWQKKRIEEHQRSFDEGKGMGGIIMDQIAEVWNGTWKPSSKQDGEATDEKPPEKK